MSCRKCGSKKITRREAGKFFCQRCGMQPGTLRMDRAGNPSQVIAPVAIASSVPYVFAPREQRLVANPTLGLGMADLPKETIPALTLPVDTARAVC